MAQKEEQFAILNDYPKDGPDMPDREKVHREKNKHDPGTGRRDREKRDGRGKDNWGNALDDQLAVNAQEDYEEEANDPNQEPEKPHNYQPAGKYFEDDDDDDDGKKKKGKQTVKVPPGYGKLVKAGEGQEIVEQDPSLDPDRKLPKPQPKLEKKPKREPYVPEKEDKKEEEEENEENAQHGKKPRYQQFHGVQHNRSQAAPHKGGQQKF